MKNKIYDANTYPFNSSDNILVDTNIWLYLFPAPTNSTSGFAQAYSNTLKRIINAKATPLLDPSVLGEYLNRYCRIEWEGSFKTAYPVFKNFRKSKDFTGVSSTASAFARHIVKLCDTHSTSTNELDFQQAITSFESGTLDFTDAVLIDICQKRGFKLLTNDADFQTGGIEVLTSNPKLLRV